MRRLSLFTALKALTKLARRDMKESRQRKRKAEAARHAQLPLWRDAGFAARIREL